MGPTSIDGRVKRLLSPDVAHRIGLLKLNANDNFAGEVRLAA